MRLAVPATLALSSLVGILGCSGGSAPTSPRPQTPTATQSLAPALPLLDHTSGTLAAFDLTIDSAAGRAELQPLRAGSAIGDTFSEIGLAPAFTELFGKNFRVVGLRSTGADTIEVDFEITHPFLPIKRPDLGIFNTKCWVITDRPGTDVGGVIGIPDLVTNADGQGTMWADTADAPEPITNVQVQPYVILHEDPSSAPFDFNAPAGFNVLFPGQVSVDTVGLDLGGANTLNVRIYLTADYGQSAVRATRQTPAYELPKFAGNAPWKVAVTQTSNTLEQGNTSSQALYQIDIWDWKHGQGLASDVTGATVSVPDLMSTPVTVTLAGTGTDPTPLTGSALITNALDAIGGDYWGLVTVTDEATGIGLKEDLSTPIALSAYKTYQWFPVVVTAPSIPPTAVINIPCEPANYSTLRSYDFDGSASLANAGTLTDYEWDWDYDGVIFNVDDTGALVSHTFGAGLWTVALRVRNSGNLTDIAQEIIVASAPSWGPVTRITNNTWWDRFEDQGEYGPTLLTAADGSVHIIHFRNSAPSTIFEQTLDTCTGVWSAPSDVYVGYVGYGNVSACATADGKIHLSAPADTSGRYSYFTKTGATWSAPINIMTAQAGGYFDHLYIQTNGAGDIGALGIFEPNQPPTAVNGNGIPANPGTMYFTKLTAGTFPAQTAIGSIDYIIAFPNPGGTQGLIPSISLAGTTGSEFVAIWQTLKIPYTGSGAVPLQSNIRWNRTTGGTWGAATNLYTANSDHDRCVLQRGPDGKIWLTAVNGANVYLGNYDGTAWTPSLATIFNSVGSTGAGYIGFDPAGSAVIVAAGQSFGSQVLGRHFTQTDTPATVATKPLVTLSPSTAGILQRFPMAVGFDNGTFAVVFTSTRYGAFTEGQELDSLLYR